MMQTQMYYIVKKLKEIALDVRVLFGYKSLYFLV
jgi:hypothetical protein